MQWGLCSQNSNLGCICLIMAILVVARPGVKKHELPPPQPPFLKAPRDSLYFLGLVLLRHVLVPYSAFPYYPSIWHWGRTGPGLLWMCGCGCPIPCSKLAQKPLSFGLSCPYFPALCLYCDIPSLILQ